MTSIRSARAIVLRVTALFRRGALDRDLAAEMDSHLQLHIDDNLKAGMTPIEARRQAIIALGGVEQTKEQYRDRRGLPSLESFLQDVRFAGRMLRKQPAFTLSALSMLTLGLALAACTYTVLNGLFVRGWAVPDLFGGLGPIVIVWIAGRGGHRLDRTGDRPDGSGLRA